MSSPSITDIANRTFCPFFVLDKTDFVWNVTFFYFPWGYVIIEFHCTLHFCDCPRSRSTRRCDSLRFSSVRLSTTWYSNSLYYPGQKKKKEPCCWCIKPVSCDIEESWSLITCRTASECDLCLPRLHASMHGSEIRPQILQYNMMHHQDGSFFLARVV